MKIRKIQLGAALAFALVFGALPAAAEIGLREVEPAPADAHRHRIDLVKERLLSRLSDAGAAADLYELRDLLETGGSLERAADLLYRVAGSWRTHPHVRSLARRLLADVERKRGRIPRMEAQLAALGVIQDVSVIGPFPNVNGEGFERRFGPEITGDLAAEHEGEGHPVRWRALPGLGRTGTLVLDEAFRTGGERTYYVLTQLRAPRSMRATLYLGTPGPARAWLGGRAIYSDPDDHPARFDQRAIPLDLRAGENPLLLKIASRGSFPLVLEMRVADERGVAIRGLRARAPTEGRYPTAEPIPAGRILRGNTPLLSELAGRWSPRGRLDWAWVLGERHPFDAKEKRQIAAAEQAARAAPHWVEAQLLAARARHDDHNARRRWLERALAAERPGELWAHTALARHWLDRGAPWKALELLSPVLETAPGEWPAHLVWARAWESVGETARARRIVEALLERFPDEPSLHLELAHQARRDGQVDEAMRRLRVALALRPADRGAASTLASALLEAGNARGAIEALAAVERLLPPDVALKAWRAELLAANGSGREGRALFDEVLALAADTPRLWERLGELELAAGNHEKAREAFLHALGLAPQNAHLREKIQALDEEEAHFATPFLRDLFVEVERFEAPADEDAVRLAEVRAVRVLPSGQASRFEQSIVWVGTQRGADRFRTFRIRYAPGRQMLQIERARILRPSGAVDGSHLSSEESVDDTEAGIYYDAKLRLITFPSLRPGDIVELVYRLEDIARDNLLSDSFGDIQLAQDTVPIASWEYVLKMPPGREIFANTLEGASYERSPTEDGVLHRWKVENAPKLVAEPRMPGWVEIARYLHVSTFASWDEVASYWWGLVKEQIEPTPLIREEARKIVASIPARDLRGRVQAIHRYVLEKTRYVGLELGIHSYKPYEVEQVLRRGFGDCKDKAALTHALLRAVGIDSRLVLLRMRSLGRVEEEPASLAVFNHAILYVPALDLYLDGTAEWSGISELPEADRDAEILIVHPDGSGTRTRTGDGPMETNLVETRLSLSLGEEGRAKGEGALEAVGIVAPGLRQAYASPNRRKQAIERRFGRTYPGLDAEAVEISDPRAIDEPFAIRFQVEIPSFAEERADGDLVLHPFGKESRYLYRLAPLGRRRHPLVLPPPGRERLRVEVELPEGADLRELPEGGEIRSPFGVFLLSARVEANRLVLEREFSLEASRIAPEAYSDFRDFLRQVDAMAAPRVLLRKVASEPTG